MTGPALSNLRPLEGRRVAIALSDGSRIDDCQLVSLPLRGLHTFWLFADGEDMFVPVESVVAVWESSTSPLSHCAA